MGVGKIVCLSVMGVCLMLLPAFGAGQDMMRARVPADKLQEARALTNPLTATPEILEKGKAIYEGKGTCFNCHGKNGRGKGPGAANLNPPPRVFKSHGFWKHRTEGEIFWVIKHGSPGTAMIPFGGLLSDEDIWTVMLYERSFAGKYGRGGGRHSASGMDGGQRKKGGHGGSKGKRDHGSGGCGSEGKDHHSDHHKNSLKHAEHAATAATNIGQAIQTAKDHVAGTAIEAEFETEEGTAFWEVNVLSADGKLMEVLIDSDSGAILSAEEKSHEKKQKRMQKRKGRKGSHESGHSDCAKKDDAEHAGHHGER